ncbi:hypothetical protein [Streptomyces sp. NPDC048111]|uniref:hypothetical protein n=1 Tax=Streptomyces sp. NPDC048111 TaxID=3365500 RepID=UPI003724AB9B
MISSADELLVVLDPLPHAARLRRTALTAHRLAARGELSPLLAALDARGPYERRLGALAALAAGELSHLAARLGDPDPVVRRYALRAARRPEVPDAAIEAAYDDAPAVVRAGLARLLRDGGRPALAERLVVRVATEYGVPDAARLLAGCSADFAAERIDAFAEGLTPEDLLALARRHPAAVLDHAERTLAGLGGQARDAWWRRHSSALAAALPAAPAHVLDLLERYGPDGLPDPVHDRLTSLVAVDAERVARWLADPERAAARWERTPGRAAMRMLVAADPPSLPRLGAKWCNRQAFTDLLRSMPLARRAGFLDASTAEMGPYERKRVAAGALALLPRDERHSRARAAVAEVRAEQGTHWEVWELLALLPSAEARPELSAALANGDADERGTIWDRLIVNAALTREPTEVAAVLALAAARLTNERDPVREEALSAIVAVPVPLLRESLATDVSGAGVTGAHALRRLCEDGLRARDCSPATRLRLRTLAVRLLAAGTNPPQGAQAAATVEEIALRSAAHLIEALTAHTGTVELGPPGSLRGPAVHTVLNVLGPWLDRAAERRDTTPLLALLAACGSGARRIPQLQERLEQALLTCPDNAFDEIAAVWLADPATRGERVVELLRREPSAAFVPSVLTVIAAERTDLLDHALPHVPPAGGRFPATGAPRPLPPFRCADRWLPRQQQAAVRLAAAVVDDAGRGLDERAALLRAVAPVPEHGRALLRQYTAASFDGDPALTAAALDAFAHTDEPTEVLGGLLDHAGDDRAAAVWSAAGRAVAHARPTRVAPLIRDVLVRESGVKVTVRKAAVRLAAHHLPPATARALLSTAGRAPDVHPDVAATVVSAAAALLPAEDMWALLESAAVDGPDEARRALLDLSPSRLAPALRPRYGELLSRLPALGSVETAHQALYTLKDWGRYAPEAGRALAEVYTDLASPLEVRRAGYGLRELAASELPHPVGGVRPGSLMHGVVDRLLARVAAGDEGGEPGADLPARRRLHSLVASAITDPRLCADLARQLAAEPALARTRTALLVRAIDLRSSVDQLHHACAELTKAIEGRPVLATRVAEDVEDAHRYGSAPLDPAAGLAVAGTLGAQGGLVEGLLAVALVTALGLRTSWPPVCRAAILALRRHPEHEVREAAYVTDLSAD